MLSDVNILKHINKDFIIDPFNANRVNPIGYDLSIGGLLFSKKNGLLTPVDGNYLIEANDTIHILTKESLWLSSRIAGTIHPRVSNVTRGFSHISTTVDPGWIGPLLVTMTNLMDEQIQLDSSRAFCTILLYRLDSETRLIKRRFSFIQKTLIEQIQYQENEYLDKVTNIVDAEYVEKMHKQIALGNSRITKRIAERIQINRLKNIGEHIYNSSLGAIVLVIAFVPIYWDTIKHYFHNISYDSTVMIGQITSIIAILALMASGRQK